MLKSLSQLYNYRLRKGGPGSGRKKESDEVMKLPEDKRKDYWEHRRAGTPHWAAMGLAERQPSVGVK